MPLTGTGGRHEHERVAINSLSTGRTKHGVASQGAGSSGRPGIPRTDVARRSGPGKTVSPGCRLKG